MATLLFGKRMDDALRAVGKALAAYEDANPAADASYCRADRASIRIRVVDAAFVGLTKAARGDLVWPTLRTLPDDVQDEISVLLLLAPDEVDQYEFSAPKTKRRLHSRK